MDIFERNDFDFIHIITQCAWCTSIMDGPFKGTVTGYKIPEYSHGMCDSCKDEQSAHYAITGIQRASKKLFVFVA